MSILNIFRKKSGNIAAVYPAPLPDAVWTPTDYERLAKAGYQQNPVVKSCVDLIAESTAAIRWKLFEKKSGENAKPKEIDNHLALERIRKPNDDQSGKQFRAETIKNYLLAGNNYTLKLSPDTGENRKFPRYLVNLKPYRVKIIPSQNAAFPVAGYKYTVSGKQPQTFKVEDVLHIKDYHPTDDWYGLSRLQVAARAIDISNMIDEWHNRLLQNDCRPPGAFNFKGGKLDEETQKTLEKKVEEKFLGYKHAGRPPVLGGGEWEWLDFGIKPRDMDHKTTALNAMRQICGIFNVPPEMLWDESQKTYSNFQEARKYLYMETCLPLLDMLIDEYNRWFIPLFGDNLYFGYDKNEIEAIQEDRQKKYEYLTAADFMEDNEKRIACGLDEAPWGNAVFKQISKIALGSGPKSDEGMKRKSSNKSFWEAPERKEALWNNFVLRVKAKERRFQQLAIEYMDDQKKRIKKGISGNVLSAIIPEKIIDIEEEAKEYQKKLMPWYVDTFIKAGEAGLSATKGELYSLEEKQEELGFDFTPGLEERLNFLILESGTKVNETLIDLIYRTFQRAISEDWTVEEFTQMINHQIDEFKPWKARLWSRTESTSIENWGQTEGYKQAEFVERKGWLSAFAPDSRQSHMNTDSQVVGLDDPFDVEGVKMMYPGDSSLGAGPEDVCNCLCSTFPEVVKIEGD